MSTQAGGSEPLALFAEHSVRLLVVGDVMLDRYWHGAAERISPEAPVPVVRVAGEDLRVGGAGNVALNAAALGAHAELLGAVGEDEAGTQVQRLLQAGGVQALLQASGAHRTVAKLRVVARQQQLIRLDFEDLPMPVDQAALAAAFAQRLAAGAVQAVVLSDYAKGVLADPQALIAPARAAGLPVVVDPKGTDFTRYRGASVLTPNLAEFEAVAGRCADEADIARRGTVLCEALGLQALLVTRGSAGMSLLARGQAPLHLPAQAREVFDVTGAGDTVAATLGAALGAGMPLAQAVRLANVAAGIAVTRLGTACVGRAELLRALAALKGMGDAPADGLLRRGVLDEAALAAQVALARGRGERLVMTNGCFDLLHPGHIDTLEKARALGDRLIVAVNDDASVARLKGPARPVQNLAARMRMLAALSCVDWVVPFAEDTPERLYRELLPHVQVKGGDYLPEQIAGAQHVKAAGGEVRVLDFVQGHSTSALIARIRAAGTGTGEGAP